MRARALLVTAIAAWPCAAQAQDLVECAKENYTKTLGTFEVSSHFRGDDIGAFEFSVTTIVSEATNNGFISQSFENGKLIDRSVTEYNAQGYTTDFQDLVDNANYNLTSVIRSCTREDASGVMTVTEDITIAYPADNVAFDGAIEVEMTRDSGRYVVYLVVGDDRIWVGSVVANRQELKAS